jgi:hypothetical protein
MALTEGNLTKNFFNALPMRPAESMFPYKDVPIPPTVRRKPKKGSNDKDAGQYVPIEDFRDSVNKITDLTKKLTDSPAQLAKRFQGYSNQAQQSRDEKNKNFLSLVGGKEKPKKSTFNRDFARDLLLESTRQGEEDLNKKDPVTNFVTEGFKGGPIVENPQLTYDKGIIDITAKNKRDRKIKLPDVGGGTGALASDRRVGYGSQGSGGGSDKPLDSDRRVGYGSQGSGGGSSRGPLDSNRSLGYGSLGSTYSPNRDLIKARKLKRLGAPEAAKALEMRYALGPDSPAIQSVRQRKTLQDDNEAAQRQHKLNLEIMKASMATNLNQNRFDRINLA